MLTKRQKKKLSHVFKDNRPTSLNHSLLTHWHSVYGDETRTDYTLFDVRGWSQEQIAEMLRELEVHNNSNFDCSGTFCTSYIDAHINPTGLLSVIHKLALDV